MFQGILMHSWEYARTSVSKERLANGWRLRAQGFQEYFPPRLYSRSWVQDSNLKTVAEASPQQSSLVIILATLAPTECALPPGLTQGGDAVDSKKLLGVCIANRNSNPERSPQCYPGTYLNLPIRTTINGYSNQESRVLQVETTD